MSYLDLDTATGRSTRKRRYNLLDGVDFQASSSKPTVRSDGSALQTGDRWLDTPSRIWFYWNGTYWLSEQIYSAHTPFGGGASATGGLGHHRVDFSYNLFLLDFSYGGQLAATQDGSNYWEIKLERGNSAASHTTISTISTAAPTISTQTGVSLVNTLNTHLDVSTLAILYLRVAVIKTGSAGNLVQSVATTRYRLAKP